MANATDDAAEALRLGFCPFCRESFEGERVCPDHELPLVAWHALPRARAEDDPSTPLAWHAVRHGRGWSFSGAALVLAAFCTGSLAVVPSEPALDGRLWVLALGSAPKLWLVPAAACVQLSLLWRRRTLMTLRGARVAAAFLALVPPAVCAWTWRGMQAALALFGTTTGAVLTPRPGAAAILVAFATVCSLVGAARLGRGGASA